MRQTKITRLSLARMAAAALPLLATLLGSAPAPAAGSAAGAADPSARCDRNSPERVERAFERERLMPISSYDDDPFVQDSVVECVAYRGFTRTDDGRLVLAGEHVAVQDEPVIFRLNPATGFFEPIAWNPWPVVALANEDGSFRFPEEPRFPLLHIERDAEGRPILREGLQVWTPFDLRRGMTTIFEAATRVKQAAEDWSGRRIEWGIGGVLNAEAHVFVDFNAFYSPSTRMLFFGVLPYRLPGTTEIRVFETATSWEMAAHESGHAVHHVLKPHGTTRTSGCGPGGSRSPTS